MERKVVYYTDELSDEFSEAKITPRPIDGNYVYCPASLFKKFTSFFWYRIVGLPCAFAFLRLKFRHRTVGRKKLRDVKGGYFIYGNHTQDIGDACTPAVINFPKRTYVIVHANNVSMPHIGLVTASMGAIPLPDGLAAHKNFTSAIERRFSEGKAVAIYPEAHIWPYFTGIRNFGDASFTYPVKLDAPVFCFTNTYQKRRFSEKPRIVTYIDGPFYPDKELPRSERRAKLRDQVYDAMRERSKLSEVTVIEYLKADKE
ncbi:MAG: hypothetical protein J5793_01860 [Clostridia bacterium]|nr:hypothetical protein [Clostridia bacterium]